MCMFIAPVASVRSTRIFAKRHRNKQIVVYEARLVTASDNAMILPIPLAPGTHEDVELLDLSAYPKFFDNLLTWSGYVPPAAGPGAARSTAPLAVVKVGSFDASIVPGYRDFARLDTRLVIPPGVQQTLARLYPDDAFVVYRLGAGEQKLHPFGYAFESRFDRLFFPTVHVHDGGDAPATAVFQHALYAQHAQLHARAPKPVREYLPRWQTGWHEPPPDFIDLDAPIDSGTLGGELPNIDTFADAHGV